MNPLDLLIHLAGFVAPAAVLALLVAFCARLAGMGKSGGLRFWPQVALAFVAGVAVLGAGLWWFGRDGKMATYAALVLVVATVQWLAARGWRRG